MKSIGEIIEQYRATFSATQPGIGSIYNSNDSNGNDKITSRNQSILSSNLIETFELTRYKILQFQNLKTSLNNCLNFDFKNVKAPRFYSSNLSLLSSLLFHIGNIFEMQRLSVEVVIKLIRSSSFVIQQLNRYVIFFYHREVIVKWF